MLHRRPSPAAVLAFVALLVALGGTAPAAPVVNAAARLLTGKEVKDGSLTGRDVRNSSLTGSDVKNRALTPSDFRGSVTGPQGAQGPTGATGPSGVTAVRRLPVNPNSDSSLTVDYELLRDVGTFAKASDSSRIKLSWNGQIRGTGAVAWFCDFQLRVDGAEAEGTGGRAAVLSGGGGQNDSTAGATVFFNDLSAGAHDVQIWVRGDSAMPLSCSIADGGFADEIFVEEMPA